MKTLLLIVSEGDIMGEIRRRPLHLELGSERHIKMCSLKHCWGREKQNTPRRRGKRPRLWSAVYPFDWLHSSIGLCLRYLWQLSERRFFFSFLHKLFIYFFRDVKGPQEFYKKSVSLWKKKDWIPCPSDDESFNHICTYVHVLMRTYELQVMFSYVLIIRPWMNGLIRLPLCLDWGWYAQ